MGMSVERVERTVDELITQLIAYSGESVKEGWSAHVPKPIVHSVPVTRTGDMACDAAT